MRKGQSWLAVSALLITLAGAPFIAIAQDRQSDGTGSSGTSSGTVMEITGEWILILRPGGLPLRHWFKWIGASDPTPDKEIQSTAARLKAGDKVEFRWSFDDRERIESLALVSASPTATETPKQPPPNEPTPAPAAASSTNAAPAGLRSVANNNAAPATTTGEVFNTLIDKLLAGGGRVLELPLFMFLGAIGSVGLVVALAIGRYARKGGRAGIVRALFIAEAALGLLAVALVVDRKIARLQRAVTELRSRTSADAAALLNAVAKLEARRHSFLCEPAAVQKILAEQFGEVTLRPLIYDEATDIVQVQIKRPLAKAYVAVVDLGNPAVEIKLGVTLDKKKLTSEFARETDCTVAINGEAGNSPAPNSGLGDWRGNMVRLGELILREDPKYPAPFLSFDRQNHANFTAAASTNRIVAPEGYNVIWGRWDAIVDGVVPSGDAGNRQPRTAMAINRDGTRLYLLVADGRQPGYSTGLSRGAVGQCLKAFGAHNGMLCDEGGSSCIYLKQFGGIANIPADNYGMERPTYTHFGIRLRGDKSNL